MSLNFFLGSCWNPSCNCSTWARSRKRFLQLLWFIMYWLPEFEITSQAKRLNVDAYRTAGTLWVCAPGSPPDLFSMLMFPKLLSRPLGFWLLMITGQQMSCYIYRTKEKRAVKNLLFLYIHCMGRGAHSTYPPSQARNEVLKLKSWALGKQERGRLRSNTVRYTSLML